MKTKVSNNNEMVQNLNNLLADLQIVYQNLRTMHWLVKGPDFYMLHKLYEEYYNETAELVDEVAERVLMLGGTPLHTFSDYLSTAKVAQVTEVGKGRESLKTVADNYQYLLASYRELLELSGENKDEATSAMMSELIGSTEKKLWMLNATLS